MNKINSLRKRIDVIDDSIIQLLKQRFSVSKTIYKTKIQRAQELNSEFSPIDEKREEQIKTRQKKNFSKNKSDDMSHKDDDRFIESLMTLILTHSKKIQIQNENKSEY